MSLGCKLFKHFSNIHHLALKIGYTHSSVKRRLSNIFRSALGVCIHVHSYIQILIVSLQPSTISTNQALRINRACVHRATHAQSTLSEIYTKTSIQSVFLTKPMFFPILHAHPKQIDRGIWLKLYEKASLYPVAKCIVSTVYLVIF